MNFPSFISPVRAWVTNRPRAVAWFAAGIAVFAIGGALVAANAYPVAFVNGAPVYARRFSRNYQTAMVYYRNLQQAKAPVNDVAPEVIEASVLGDLIDAELIFAGARAEVGSELDGIVKSKIAEYANDPQVQEGARRMYGLSFAEFQDALLVPQARQDILAGRLYLRNENIETWLASAREKAKVVILSPRFAWNGKRVTLNGKP